MNSNKRKFSEQEDQEFRAKWQQPLRTVFTKEDIAEIIAAIKSHDTVNPVSTAA
jgi:hypothetical protein